MPTLRVDPLQQLVRSAFQDVTPIRLNLLLVANCLGALLFCLASVATVQQHEHAVKTLGLDAAPSVIAAHQIAMGVLKMDTDLANELLLKPGQPEVQWISDEFEKWRVTVCKQLVAAANNITYGSSEQIPLENITIALGQFEMQAQSARDMHKAGKDAEALASYRASLKTIQEILLPNADALNNANAEALESTYLQEVSESALSCGFVLVIGMVLVALLAITQVYLTGRFRRRLNLPLLIATVCTALFVQHLYSALRENSHHLKVAKEDAYNSIVSLLDARANAYNANASESRWLLDREQAGSHEKAFFDKMSTVASFAPGHNFTETVARANKQLGSGEKFQLPGFKGSLADEFTNVRFEGEGQAALEALQALGDYYRVDGRMRELERSAPHAAAVKLCLGYEPYASQFPFTKFDDALGRALKINQDHFDRAVTKAFDDLKGLVVFSQIVSLLIAFCTYAGLRPRLAEYMP